MRKQDQNEPLYRGHPRDRRKCSLLLGALPILVKVLYMVLITDWEHDVRDTKHMHVRGSQIYCLLRCPHFSVLIRGVLHNYNSEFSCLRSLLKRYLKTKCSSIFSIISTLHAQSSVSSTTLSNREKSFAGSISSISEGM